MIIKGVLFKNRSSTNINPPSVLREKMKNLLYDALDLDTTDKLTLHRFAKQAGVSLQKLDYYNRCNIIPSGSDLKRICRASGIPELKLKIKMGILDSSVRDLIQQSADEIFPIIKKTVKQDENLKPAPKKVMETELGILYQGDCLDLMPHLESDSTDLVFADPPFNLNKLYPSKIDDNLKTEQYLKWCERWLGECVRILKYGGSLFLWNLPKWNSYLAQYLNRRLTFRHWISVNIKYSLPIRGRLYPSHYSLLYYCKGDKPNVFHPDRLPMDLCPHCRGDIKDYGGYKNKMNPEGINLTDVWSDIPPVRHKKYKKRNGSNELSVKLMDRIIEMASDKDDVIFDPFGGSGTTYAVAEIKKRKWIGVEVGPVEDIIKRFENLNEDAQYLAKIRKQTNCLITSENLRKRIENGWWTPESVRKKKIGK